MLHQSQPIYPCSGCLRCSDGCRRRCRGRSSEHAIDVRHLRTGHNYALLSNPGTHHNALSAGIAWERVVMARSYMPDVNRSKWHFSTIYNAYVRMTRATRRSNSRKSLCHMRAHSPLTGRPCSYRTRYRGWVPRRCRDGTSTRPPRRHSSTRRVRRPPSKPSQIRPTGASQVPTR